MSLPAHGSSDQGAIVNDDAALLNAWAFLSEKVLHGNPSGVDNSVSIHGGALGFTRTHPRNGLLTNEMKSLRAFQSVRFLLTDTKIGRDTKKLVANVGKQLEEEPERVKDRLEAIQAISNAASQLLGGNVAMSRPDMIKKLCQLIDENHAHLVDLQVSHPALEAIRTTTAGKPWELSTKLTGAGGGGCAVTLLPDELRREDIESLIRALEQQGFACYETSVGGPGVGALIADAKQRNSESKVTSEAGETQVYPGASLFAESDGNAIATWAQHQGSDAWAYA